MSHISCEGCKVPEDEREGYCMTTINISKDMLKNAGFNVAEMVQRYMRRPRPAIPPELIQPLRLGGPCPYRK